MQQVSEMCVHIWEIRLKTMSVRVSYESSVERNVTEPCWLAGSAQKVPMHTSLASEDVSELLRVNKIQDSHSTFLYANIYKYMYIYITYKCEAVVMPVKSGSRYYKGETTWYLNSKSYCNKSHHLYKIRILKKKTKVCTYYSFKSLCVCKFYTQVLISGNDY